MDQIIIPQGDNVQNSLTNTLNKLADLPIVTSEEILSDFINENFITEIKRIYLRNDVRLLLSSDLKTIKVTTRDASDREHCISIKSNGNHFHVNNTDLPPADYQNTDFKYLECVIDAFLDHINSLETYFYELDRIDRLCTVVEPVKPCYKNGIRKIVLDTKVWLNIEVNPEGRPVDIHLIGDTGHWTNLLEDGLRKWDLDNDITENLLRLFNLDEFPRLVTTYDNNLDCQNDITCSICLLGTMDTVPQPLCSNVKCESYYHRSCLYQWLITSSGGRVPTFGVATGSCPLCSNIISCNKE